jgi:PHS family inorganic phosphate transporter-like MFS transporter
MPTKIYPTRNRCTCHGISAAVGKLGSTIVQASLLCYVFSSAPLDDPNSDGLGWVLIIFSGIMAYGTLFAWALIPDVQDLSGAEDRLAFPSKTLDPQ